MTGENPAKTGNEAFSGAPSSGCYATQDGLLMRGQHRRQFVALCTALGADLTTDPRFADRHIRRHNQEALRQAFATTASNTAAAWEALLDAAGVPAAKVRTIREVLDEGQPAARSADRGATVGADRPSGSRRRASKSIVLCSLRRSHRDSSALTPRRFCSSLAIPPPRCRLRADGVV